MWTNNGVILTGSVVSQTHNNEIKIESSNSGTGRILTSISSDGVASWKKFTQILDLGDDVKKDFVDAIKSVFPSFCVPG